MKWRLVLNITATACGMIAAGTAVICAFTLLYAVTCIWSVPGTRFELHLGRGLVFVCQLHEFRDNVSFRWEAYRLTLLPPPTPVPRRSPWWHGDNSWWQGI